MTAAAIFDLDATLVDSQRAARTSFSEAYQACQLVGEAPADAFIALSGIPLEEVCIRLSLPPAFPEQFRAASRRLTGELKLFPGVRSLLKSLHNHSIPMGIITGKDRARTFEILKALDIDSYFGSVVTPNDPPAPKPSPEGVLWVCRLLGAAPSDSIVIGDSILDVQAGRDAGAVTVGCTWGVADRDAFISEGVDFIAESVDSLSEFLYSRYQIGLGT